MSEAKHTPTPWSHKEDDARIFGADGLIVACTMGQSLRSLAQHESNAAFIVRACNNFDALLAACKAARKLFSEDHALDHFDWGKSFLRAEDIRELNELPIQIARAIAAAEGKD